jgi:hypothetical protein
VLFASPLAAQRGGGGGGGGDGGGSRGGGGGGWNGGSRAGGGGGSPAGRTNLSHGPSYNPSRSGPTSAHNFSGGHPSGNHLYSGHPPAGRVYSGHYSHPVGSMAYHHGYYGGWYHGDWHDHYHWGPSWHYGPAAWFTAGVVTGALVWDTPWRWGYWSYYNPYCTTVVIVDGTPIDYSRPIVVASVPTANQPLADDRAAQFLDAARDAFARGDYATAMTQVNAAIAQKPNDTVPHEFRALVLFATGRYKEAAGAVYAVLSVGPGWDWATLSSFYPDPNVYTAHLRALEQYRNDHIDSPEIRFLLGYQYMSCSQKDAAIAELKEVVRLSPKDQLSAQLLTALSQNPTDTKPTIAATPAPAAPVSAASLVGNWEATRSDGASFSLEIAKDGTYSWRHTLQGKSQNYSGAYTVADNLLILKEGGTPAMIGQVALVDGNRFNFKLAGNNPADPGLTFSRKL